MRHHFVAQPAFPQEHPPRGGLGIDEGQQMFGRIVGASRRRHQHREPRVFELQRPRSRRHRDVKGTRYNTVRVDMATVRPAGLQDIDPQAVELERLGEVEMRRLRKRLHFLVEQALEIMKRRVALGQVVQARIARITLIAMIAAPRATRAILFSKHPAAVLQLGEQVGRADVGFIEKTGEQRTNGHDGRKAQQVRTRKGDGDGRV